MNGVSFVIFAQAYLETATSFRGYERLIIQASALTAIVFGALLFKWGVADKSDVMVQKNEFKVAWLNAPPGLILSGFGIFVCVFALISPVHYAPPPAPTPTAPATNGPTPDAAGQTAALLPGASEAVKGIAGGAQKNPAAPERPSTLGTPAAPPGPVFYFSAERHASLKDFLQRASNLTESGAKSFASEDSVKWNKLLQARQFSIDAHESFKLFLERATRLADKPEDLKDFKLEAQFWRDAVNAQKVRTLGLPEPAKAQGESTGGQ